MASGTRSDDASHTRQLAAAVTVIAGILTFGLTFGVLVALVQMVGWVGPFELAFLAVMAGIVTWIVVRRLRRA